MIKATNTNRADSGLTSGGHTLPKAQGSWDPPRTSQEQSTFSVKPAPGVNQYHPSRLHNSHHSAKPPMPNIQLPNTAPDLLPAVIRQSDFNFFPNLAGPGVPDLSAMMFPSADPFAYPNQPMITLENTHRFKQEHDLDPPSFDLPASSAHGTDMRYDDVNAQDYDQIPVYAME